MKYDFAVNLEMIELSPNSFKTFVYGALAAVSSLIFSIYSWLLDCGTLVGFKFFLFRKPLTSETVVTIQDFTPVSTAFFLRYLLSLIIIFSVFLLYHSMNASKNNEGTFLFTIGIFLDLFAIANSVFSLFDTVDITDYYLFLL